MPKPRVYSHLSLDLLALLGREIRLARARRRWSEREVAERAGISRTTLVKIEKGDPRCEIGLVFEVAVLCGIRLFDIDSGDVIKHLERSDSTLTLLPKRIRSKRVAFDDDF